MRFFRGNRFAWIFFVLLIFCSAMVVSQFMVNQSRHVELRENFIILDSKEAYPEKAERLYKRLLRELEDLPNKALMDDYQRTFMLVYPATPPPDNLIWKYHVHVRNELVKRSAGTEATLQRALKMAEEEK